MQLTDSSLLRNQAYIDGLWTDAQDEATFDVTNPANGNRITSVPDMGIDDTRAAIEAANEAWCDWRERPAKERSQLP